MGGERSREGKQENEDASKKGRSSSVDGRGRNGETDNDRTRYDVRVNDGLCGGSGRDDGV